MKKLWSLLVLLTLLVACLPAAQADDAGALSVDEFRAWISELLTHTVGVSALNAPVGEESLTDDGYAYIYDHMTLYYDKAELDENSRLQAVVLTDDLLESPRGLRIGGTLQDIIDLYGWLNPDLEQVNGVIPLYVQDEMPQSAYWAWAQGDSQSVSMVQCAIHYRLGEDRYTDAGIVFTLEDNVISGLRVYGVNQSITEQEVRNNLAVLSGGAAMPAVQPAAPSYVFTANSAAKFSADDLRFAGLDYSSLTEEAAQSALGDYSDDQWVEDDTGDWLHVTHRDGISITLVLNAQRTKSRADSILITSDAIEGPRGVKLGMRLEDVAALFACDGQNMSLGNATLLYGDGDLPPYGLCEISSEGVVLCYATEMTVGIGRTSVVCLRITFQAGLATEINIYTLQ